MILKYFVVIKKTDEAGFKNELNFSNIKPLLINNIAKCIETMIVH